MSEAMRERTSAARSDAMPDATPEAAPAPTPARLLEAARTQFGEHGYTGASVRDITRSAGVNLGAVTYHFGSKRKLYEAVLAGAVAPLRERVGAAAATEGPPEDRLDATLASILDCLREEPGLPVLLFQQVSVGEPAPVAVRESLTEVLRTLAGLVRAGKAAGTLEAGDPILTATSLLAETVTVELLRRTVSEDRDRPGMLGRSAAGIESHVLEFTRRALERRR